VSAISPNSAPQPEFASAGVRAGRTVRMVDQEIMREQFYVQTPAEGAPEQKGRFRRQRYLSALDWAEQKRLIGVVEIGGLTYLYLLNPQAEAEQTMD
jgi:hypothetical protein